VESGRADQIATMTTPLGPPAGWYSDPADPSVRRYWDGQAWLEPKPRLTAGKSAAIMLGAVAILITAVIALAAVVSTSGSQSRDEATAEATDSPAVDDDSEEPETTVDETTTTERPTTTTVPVPDYQGLVFGPGTEPTFTAEGITARITRLFVVDVTDPEIGGLVDDCAWYIGYDVEQGGPPANSCLAVEWSFDVASDFRVDANSPDGSLTPGAFVAADGIQHDAGVITSGLPGTVNNRINYVYPLTAGDTAATLHFDTGSNLVGWTTHTFQVPGAMPPLSLY
jgi:hypothetical protein